MHDQPDQYSFPGHKMFQTLNPLTSRPRPDERNFKINGPGGSRTPNDYHVRLQTLTISSIRAEAAMVSCKPQNTFDGLGIKIILGAPMPWKAKKAWTKILKHWAQSHKSLY